ncbi:MAG: hypothetical protein WBC78_06665, partial [Candidatus Sulfotelmatobacter sp.]
MPDSRCEVFLMGGATLEARESVRNLPTYRPPLGGRTGMRLDFNENTVGCSPQVLLRLRALSAEEVARYPEREP